MRAIFWFLLLFAIAVALALFAGNNQAMVTVFWPPHRIDLSVNLVLLLSLVGLIVVYGLLRMLSVLSSLPQQARQWRRQHRARAMQEALLETLTQLSAGRFVRARRAAENLIDQSHALARAESGAPQDMRLRALAHMLAAQSAHALRDRPAREEHMRQAMALAQDGENADTHVQEGLQLRAAEWALDDREVAVVQQYLDELSQGAARRTAALRLRFKAARLGGQTQEALETARLLGKHGAFTAEALPSIVAGLAIELLQSAHDPAQLMQVWDHLESAERKMPDVVIAAAQRALSLNAGMTQALRWLLPVWQQMLVSPSPLSPEQRIRLVLTLEEGFSQTEGMPDADWLMRIESAQADHPGDVLLQYLTGVACLRLNLWGKAQVQLSQALPKLRDVRLRKRAWLAMARLAEQREDAAAAAEAWRNAALA